MMSYSDFCGGDLLNLLISTIVSERAKPSLNAGRIFDIGGKSLGFKYLPHVVTVTKQRTASLAIQEYIGLIELLLFSV